MKINLSQINPQEPKIVEVEVPSLPRVGDYVEHEPTGIAGDVRSVFFFWPKEERAELVIEVRVR